VQRAAQVAALDRLAGRAVVVPSVIEAGRKGCWTWDSSKLNATGSTPVARF
jgi:hypothetical protein